MSNFEEKSLNQLNAFHYNTIKLPRLEIALNNLLIDREISLSMTQSLIKRQSFKNSFKKADLLSRVRRNTIID